MTTRDDNTHLLLGAFVLGGLSDEDVEEFRNHLRSCAQCRQELDRVAELPRVLDVVRPSEPGWLTPI
jgi:predicted anti-sigma-YlaC factor YlaD